MEKGPGGVNKYRPEQQSLAESKSLVDSRKDPLPLPAAEKVLQQASPLPCLSGLSVCVYACEHTHGGRHVCMSLCLWYVFVNLYWCGSVCVSLFMCLCLCVCTYLNICACV